MRRSLVLAGLLASIAIPVGLAHPAVALSTSYTFNLVRPNTAMAESGPFAGDTIRVTGSGAFDTGGATVTGAGSFTHVKADGSVFARGTWEATGFTSFEAFGGPNPGLQGGVLDIVITLFPKGEPPVTDVPMSVTCLINAPPGLEEGTTVGDFTEKTGGQTLFHLA
jgi:hypothetical protein